MINKKTTASKTGIGEFFVCIEEKMKKPSFNRYLDVSQHSVYHLIYTFLPFFFLISQDQ